MMNGACDGRDSTAGENASIDALTQANGCGSPGDTLRVQHLRDEVLDQLRAIIDPDLQKDIVSLGFVRDLDIDPHAGSVKFRLRLTTPACPVKDFFVSECKKRLLALDWANKADVELDSLKPVTAGEDGLKRVSFLLAVTSCKGGVGKSTVAVNLAFMLRRMGAQVGLLDADLYGPSLPVLLPLADTTIYFEDDGGERERDTALENPRRKRNADTRQTRSIAFEGPAANSATSVKTSADADSGDEAKPQPKLRPLEHNGVKVMSYGFIRNSGSQGFSALRGPFASSVIEQLLTGTAWGELDYLVIDFPPGTGDIHITLSQAAKIDACVVVTTPQTLSTADAERGVKMFNELGIATVCVVENMAHFVCDGCQKKHILFPGRQNVNQIADLAETPHVVHVPLDRRLSQILGNEACADNGSQTEPAECEVGTFPLVERLRNFPDDKVYSVFNELASVVVRELSTLRYGSHGPSVTVSGGSHVEIRIPRRMRRRHTDEPAKRWAPSVEDSESDVGRSAADASGPWEHEAVSVDVFTLPLRRVREACACDSCTDEGHGGGSRRRGAGPAKLGLAEVFHASNRSLIFVWTDGHQTSLSFQALERLVQEEDEIAGRESGSACLAGAHPELEW
ncbi:MRP family domain-containing protein [Besnoitia besnoiti]|uniref:MRP family domain-containing protein n=1 Tax=Besnoitia besnoiti TaxID=94643 RepID=A0A2A9MEH7_BESBE|nr:MRP family domain-containing protein [Besnoitia besnoiti]PFH36279.1 MRP family domain-containing protein [Besnoitia besnoiti]